LVFSWLASFEGTSLLVSLLTVYHLHRDAAIAPTVFFLLLTGLAAFAVTNIDDMLLLTVFFSDTGSRLKKRHIVLGQYVGFVVLLLLSLLGFLGALLIPASCIGLLGFYPVFKGAYEVRKRFFTKKDQPQDAEPPPHLPSSLRENPSLLGALLAPQTYSVATMTIGNGADNLSVYIPLFARSHVASILFLLVLFLLLMSVWCLIGYWLTRLPGVETVLKRISFAAFPFLLIGLGLFIVWKTGAIAWLLQVLT
jgi:cadmium resistance protein CadD (predicted permease)